VVTVPVRGDDPDQRQVVADQLEQPPRLVGRVDEQALAGAVAAQEVGVVVHRAHSDLAHAQLRQLPLLRRAADLHVSGVRHRPILPDRGPEHPGRRRALSGQPVPERPGGVPRGGPGRRSG
jgi:hypothetical protein